MLPEFDEHGYLPPGVHRATFEEVAARFGWQSELRRIEIESLGWLIELVRKAGGERLIVNGSFVTAKLEPNDVDCLVLAGPDFPRDRVAESQMLAGIPFVEVQVVVQETFDVFLERVFFRDRKRNPKGVVEVVL
jgi:hypothetical protein